MTFDQLKALKPEQIAAMDKATAQATLSAMQTDPAYIRRWHDNGTPLGERKHLGELFNHVSKRVVDLNEADRVAHVKAQRSQYAEQDVFKAKADIQALQASQEFWQAYRDPSHLSHKAAVEQWRLAHAIAHGNEAPLHETTWNPDTGNACPITGVKTSL